MKQARITNNFASTVVSCLFFDKPVSWVQVLAEVLAQQVRLMGPKNLKVCLAGYLAPIYAAKKVLTHWEAQSYQYTIQGGDPEADKDKEEEEEEEESATETESETDQEATPKTSGEEQEEAEA
jgi:hypothetical protein